MDFKVELDQQVAFPHRNGWLVADTGPMIVSITSLASCSDPELDDTATWFEFERNICDAQGKVHKACGVVSGLGIWRSMAGCRLFSDIKAVSYGNAALVAGEIEIGSYAGVGQMILVSQDGSDRPVWVEEKSFSCSAKLHSRLLGSYVVGLIAEFVIHADIEYDGHVVIKDGLSYFGALGNPSFLWRTEQKFAGVGEYAIPLGSAFESTENTGEANNNVTIRE